MTVTYKELGFESYVEYLDSDHWKDVIERYKDDKCFCCSAKDYLHLHHCTYERLGREVESDLVTVCRSCHRRIHLRVDNGWACLHDAHLTLPRKKVKRKKVPRHERKPKPYEYWVLSWDQLRYMPKRIEREDLFRLLELKGLIQEIDGELLPTELAFDLQFVCEGESGDFEWSQGRFVWMIQAMRRIQKHERKGKSIRREWWQTAVIGYNENDDLKSLSEEDANIRQLFHACALVEN